MRGLLYTLAVLAGLPCGVWLGTVGYFLWLEPRVR